MKQFRLSDEELKELLDAGKPTPAMYLSGGQPMFGSPQENANQVWKRLGRKYGFYWDTGRPANTGDQRDFLAEPKPVESGDRK